MPRRRSVAVLFALVLLAPAAAGAVSLEKGGKAGVNLSSFHGEFADIAHARTMVGFVGGAFAAIGFAPDLAIQVEALLSMKGAKAVTNSTDAAGSVLGLSNSFVLLSYFEVPVLLRGTLLRTATVQPMYYLGPTIGFNLGGKVQSDAAGAVTQDLTNLRAVDFGLALGAGAGFKLGERKVLTELRYTTGFSDINIHELRGNAESINHVFSLTAGLVF
jgi:hypothetical protein